MNQVVRFVLAAASAAAVSAVTLAAQVPQEKKPVPKDSLRVSITGCTKGYVFTAGPRIAPDVAGPDNVPAGAHLRMNGPKKLIAEIDAYKGSMIEITGLVKKGQVRPDGVALGPARIGGGNPLTSQIDIDVEGWSPATGSCPS